LYIKIEIVTHQVKLWIAQGELEPARLWAQAYQRDPTRYWNTMDTLPTVKGTLPESSLTYRVAHRVAGLGSLGRQRWGAIAEWRGARVAREARALAPSRD
jgi:hypothetical protein